MRFDADELYNIHMDSTPYKCMHSKEGCYEEGKKYCFISSDDGCLICLEIDGNGFIIDGQEPCYVSDSDMERDFVPVE